MILISSLITNIYITFLIIGFGKYKFNKSNIQIKFKQSIKGLSRIIFIVLLIYLFWISNLFIYWQGTNLIYLDGLCKINLLILICEIYLIILIMIILYFIGKDSTIQISKRPEIFFMIFINLISLIQLFNSNDFVITIITWELTNLSLYLLITMQGNINTGLSLSAGIKYFLLSALTTAFMLMGITLIYNKTGNVNYDVLISILYIINISTFDFNNYILYLGFLMIIITLMFKLGASPFHFWAPDLYDSLSFPILIYIYIIPKLSILIFMYLIMPIINQIITFTFINIFAIFSVIIGSIGLSSQWKIKRFLTYSAISHIGFILFAYISSSWDYFFYYIFIYGLTNLLIFLIFLNISNHIKGNDDDILFINEFNGLYQMNPSLTIILSLLFFSLAGIPPLIGFFLKFQVLISLIENLKIHQTFIIIFGSIISTINYLDFIKKINFKFSPYIYANIILINFINFVKPFKSFSKFFIERSFKSLYNIYISPNHKFSLTENFYNDLFYPSSKTDIQIKNVNINYFGFNSVFKTLNKFNFNDRPIKIIIKYFNSYIISLLFIFLIFLFFKFHILNFLFSNLFLFFLSLFYNLSKKVSLNKGV